MKRQQTLVILDRDGVINEDSDAYVKSLTEWIPLPGSIEAIARLSQAGFTVVIATNQSGLSRGLFGLDDLEAMHARLCELVEAAGGDIAGIFYCPHHPDEGCQCRKPAPGLLDAISRELNVPLDSVPVVGDSLRDLEAGIARGCQPILVRTGKGATSEAKLPDFESQHSARLNDPVLVVDDLAAAADLIIAGGI